MIHVQAIGFLVPLAQCHTINTSRVSMQVVSGAEFDRLPVGHKCKRCAKAAAKQAARLGEWEQNQKTRDLVVGNSDDAL